MTVIKTIIADAQYMFLEGLETIINNVDDPSIKVVGSAKSAFEIETMLEDHNVDLLIMELNFPDKDGLSLIPEIRKRYTDLRMIVLSAYSDIKLVKDAFHGGIDGYLLKENQSYDLIQGISDVMLGKTFLGPGVRVTPSANGAKIKYEPKVRKSLYEDRFLIKQKLTKREHEVLSLITQAKNNKEIATELFISDQTVGVHRKNIMRKLGVRNTVNLIKFALENELV